MQRVHIYITTPQKDQLKKLSEKIQIKPSEIIRRAIDLYLKEAAK